MIIPLFIAQIEDDKDRELLTMLYIEHRYTLLHVAQSLLHDYGLAEDAMQEAFFRLAKNIKRLRPDPKQIRSFLVTITRNFAIDTIKKRNVVTMLSWDELIFEPADNVASVEDLVAEDDEFERLAQTLPIIYSTVFLMKYKHDCSDQDIAAFLNISETAARKRIQRAKEKITEEVKKKGVVQNA
ncbi:MAG: RNA polymerase sigma factor [Firmicutes bacterium]|nr:RNA polymerase sigma factor [Bacillota bacterium]